ncbi:hypothetical protein POM88_049339 [Heracleum sosnowskyi]|uniref:Retrotransposon gag domain-containing protein n=1 Tax=Heracleum sosnowskyi TaxID=360622 RepID=A0AAD8GY18_9APIA|nr:hypothetical protein POM88_049339 [Heracleum sosnowskyi]
MGGHMNQREQTFNQKRIGERKPSYERMEDLNREIVLFQNSQGGRRINHSSGLYQQREPTPRGPTYQQREPTPRRSTYHQEEPMQRRGEPLPPQEFPYPQRAPTPQQQQNPYPIMPNPYQQEPTPQSNLEARAQVVPGLEDAAPSPFSAAVREAPLPLAFRGTGDLRFNGSTDPAEYIGRFNIEMELYQVEDLTKCRLLASTLRGNAHQWFQKLGPASITSWEQMSYFKRFNADVPTVRGASDETIKNFLIAGVRVGTDFWKNLQREEPATLAALYLQADPFKREEEALKRSDYGDAPRRGKRKESPKENRGSGRFTRSRSPSPQRFPPPPPYRQHDHTTLGDHYTPNVASIDYIYEITKDQGLYKNPAPLSRAAMKDNGKYCAYHESQGHYTHACRQLKEEIEKLIREGKLTEWVVKKVKKYREEAPVKTTEAIKGSTEVKVPEKPVFVREASIHTIFGGPHIGGNGRNAMDRYVREAQHPPLTNVNHLSERPPKLFKGEDIQIFFSEEDAKWVHHPHSDALVVSVRIGSRNVHRVFVDNGISVNILYYGTYKKMGLLDKELIQGTTHIYGFTGDSVRVKGTIKLSLTLGEGSVSVTQVFEFLVIDQSTYYNALLGRPMLKEIRVVTSIYHLSMKFPTPDGVGCIKGCQYDSRDCYRKMIRSSYKGRKGVEDGSDMPDFKEENAQETQAFFRPPYAATNMVYTIEFPEEERLKEYEALARVGTPIFFLEAPPPAGGTVDAIYVEHTCWSLSIAEGGLNAILIKFNLCFNN